MAQMEAAAAGSDHTKWQNPDLYQELVEGRALLKAVREVKKKHGME